MLRVRTSICLLLTLGWVFGKGAPLGAEIVTFTIDPLRSSLTSEATLWALGGVPLTGQDPPDNTSLTSSYSGTIQVDLDDPLSPTTIQFLNADALAMVTGEWLPAPGGGSIGSPDLNGDADPGLPAPAQFGYLMDEGPGVVGYFALRDTVLSLTSDELTVAGGSFPSLFSFEVTDGVYEYNVSTVPFGDFAGEDDVTGETAENFSDRGHYAADDMLATLTLPVDAFFGGPDADIEILFTGELVATASFGQALEGDYNDNGRVEQADLDLVLLNWGQPFDTLPTEWVNQRPTEGIVDQAELDGVLLNWGSQAPQMTTAQSVPEPNALLLLLLAPTPLIARLRW